MLSLSIAKSTENSGILPEIIDKPCESLKTTHLPQRQNTNKDIHVEVIFIPTKACLFKPMMLK